MDLHISHDSIDDIPEAYRELYTERDGKHVLTGIAGIRTQADIDRMNEGLKKERDEHKGTREKLRAFEGLDAEDVRTKLDRMTELEIAARGNAEEMDSKLEELTEARVASRLAPVTREAATLKTRLEELEAQNTALLAEKTQRTIGDQVADVCSKAKVLAEAMPDIKLLANQVFEVAEDGTVLTKENPYGITPGLAADVWLQEMQDVRPHWWPRSIGGETKGSGPGGNMSQNPWSADNWNVTKQGQVVREQGTEKASQMAKAAGSSVGAARPTVKK